MLPIKDGKEVALRAGEKITLTTDNSYVGDYNKVAITYKDLPKDLKPNNIILLDDGLISLLVISTNEQEIECLIQNSGFLGENGSRIALFF